MSDEHDERVGGVGEEALRLLGALQGWAQTSTPGTPAEEGDQTEGPGPAAPGWLHDVNAHLATGGDDCRWCPVCQVISAVRETSPEVKDHLTTAATSFLQAATGLLEATTKGSARAPRDPGADRRDPVEKIDLDDDTEWEND